MSQQSLAVRFRPKTWDDLVEQGPVRKLLEEQLTTDKVKRVVLFTGPAGTGKTTTARIFANCIESAKTNIVEINAADHTGVDDVRVIIDNCKSKPLQGKRKIFIMDEVHMLSIAAFNSLLKIFEEPPAHVVFILCTTDPQKIPATILSRVYRYDFKKITFTGTVNRLNHILQSELNNPEGCGVHSWQMQALEYIAKTSAGGLRDAITLLDKCMNFTKDLTVDDVINVLGISSYDTMFQLLAAIFNKDDSLITTCIEDTYRSGKDLKQFIKTFLEFVLDINKYLALKSLNFVSIPDNYLNQLNAYNESHKPYLKHLLDVLLKLNSELKWDMNPRVLIEGTLLLETI